VARLVLVAPGLGSWEWSEEARAGFDEEEALVERGDLAAAAEQQARLWLADDAQTAVRSYVREATLRSYELQLPVEGKVEAEWPQPAAAERLGEVGVPTLVVVGDRDLPDLQELAAFVAGGIPHARLKVIEGAGHLPSLERPDAFDAAVLPFLAT
jgi:pimeloyl-ACP methyl ester carboxylesterase